LSSRALPATPRELEKSHAFGPIFQEGHPIMAAARSRLRAYGRCAAALLLAGLAGSVQAESIFSSGFEFAKPALRGGSNLLWYALGQDCEREPYGIIPNYHEPGVRDTVRQQLSELRASGQERISIGIVHLTPATPTPDGRVSGTLLDSSGGALRPRFLQNIRDLVSDLRDAGFANYMFRWFPQGPNDAKFWNTLDPARLEDNWGVISQVEPVLLAAGLEHGTDLLVEGMPRADIIELPGGNEVIRPDEPARHAWSDYAREIWKRYVQAFGPGRSVGFSFQSDTNDTRIDARVEHKDYVYTVGGQLVLPAALALDIYGTPERDEEWIFLRYRRHLVDEGLGDMYWLITEAFYDDAIAARGFANAMTASGQNILYFTQWPLQRNSTCDPDVTVAPPADFSNYSRYGF
jgi:hypothetical protein